MGNTACTEPRCLYKGALYLILLKKRSAIGTKNDMLKRQVMAVPVAQKPRFLEVIRAASMSQTQRSSYSSNFLATLSHTGSELQKDFFLFE